MSNRILQKWIPIWLFDLLKHIEHDFRIKKWKKDGCPLPAVHPVKQDIIRYYQEKTGYRILIETGTYTGEMTYAQKKYFHEIHSVELSDYYYNRAVERFRKFSHIHLWHGDSAKILPQIVSGLSESAVFWLDAHYSGGFTAGKDQGEKQSPIIEELEIILSSPFSHTILIDDARCFNNANDYPDIGTLRSRLAHIGRSLSFDIETDIIRIKLSSLDSDQSISALL